MFERAGPDCRQRRLEDVQLTSEVFLRRDEGVSYKCRSREPQKRVPVTAWRLSEVPRWQLRQQRFLRPVLVTRQVDSRSLACTADDKVSGLSSRRNFGSGDVPRLDGINEETFSQGNEHVVNVGYDKHLRLLEASLFDPYMSIVRRE